MGNLGLSSPAFGMDKKAAIWIAIVGGLLSIAAPIVFAMYWAWEHNLQNQIELNDSIAKEVLRRSGEGVSQIDSIHTKLANAGAPDPCSSENIALMGKLNLQAEQVQAVGYVKDNVFLCSAYGHHNVALGPPTFTTPLGTKVWTSHEFAILPGTEFLLVTPKALGYTVVILPKTFLNVFTDDPKASVGLYSLSAKKIIVGKGAFEPQWLERLGKEQQVQFTDRENFVVIRRSSKFEFASFVAQPAAKVTQGLYETAFVLVPIGVVAGGMLAFTILHLARQQLTLPAILKVALKRGVSEFLCKRFGLQLTEMRSPN